MTHLDDETIALAAIGEELDEAATDHLAACDACRTEVDVLTRVVTVGRSTASPDQLVAPPPAVWARIAAETGIDPALLPASLDARRAARDETAPESVRANGPGLGRTGSTAGPTSRRPDGARSRRISFLVAASTAGLVLGVGGTLAWQSVRDDDAAVVASATLAPLPDKVGTGAAEVVDTAAGRELEMTLDMDLPPDAFLQVWLLSTDESRMVPVGVIAGSTGHWTLPPDVVLADYPLVDISIEPYDGDPAHSTNSVVRGTLDISSALAPLD